MARSKNTRKRKQPRDSVTLALSTPSAVAVASHARKAGAHKRGKNTRADQNRRAIQEAS